MSGFTRGIVRWGLIGGIALAGTTILVGPERVAAGFHHLRSKAQHLVDSRVSDPLVLRRQVAELADQYPSRIAEVEGEIAAVDRQLAQFNRDIEVAERVVAMTADDLHRLKALVNRAETESESAVRPVSIRFDGVRYDINEAYTEARRINNVRTTYRDRLEQDRQQLQFLVEQRARLAEIREKLEGEFSSFQAQLWQLDRQIDAIERNERLIRLTKEQQATLDEYERFGKVGNLKQLEGKLAQLRAVQEAQLRTLEQRGISRDYEGRAKYELDTNDLRSNNPFSDLDESDDDAVTNPASSQLRADISSDARRSMLFSDPIVIE